MRQIELHRADPSVPLVPPLHPGTQFLKRWGVPFINCIINISFLTRELTRTGPVTREQVFSIAVFTDALFLVGVMVGFLWLGESTMRVISDLTRVTGENLDRQWAIIEVLSKARLPERNPKDSGVETP